MRKNFILIFYEEDKELIKEFILKDLNHKIFNPKKYSKLIFFFCFFLYLPIYILSNLKLLKELSLRRFLSVIKFKLACKSIAIHIKILSPSAVITTIDNSPVFHLVSEYCKKITFIAIQNGHRGIYSTSEELIHKSHKYHIDQYYCFGPQVKNHFISNGQNSISEFIMCGSFKAGIYSEIKNFFTKNHDFDYHICIVSEWVKENTIKNNFRINQQKNYLLLLNYLKKYIIEQNLEISVALRTDLKDEKLFFLNFFGDIKFSNSRARNSFASYDICMQSELVIATYSTLASEMLSLGRKALYVNILGDKNFLLSKKNSIVYAHKPSYKELCLRLNNIRSFSTNYFLEKYKDDIAEIIFFSKDKAPHNLIRERIMKIIEIKNKLHG